MPAIFFRRKLADHRFIPAGELPRASQGTDILDLSTLAVGRVFVGCLYGGIRAFANLQRVWSQIWIYTGKFVW
jgi:hypothetical protein